MCGTKAATPTGAGALILHHKGESGRNTTVNYVYILQESVGCDNRKNSTFGVGNVQKER